MIFAADTLAHFAQQIGLLAGITVGIGILIKGANMTWQAIRRLSRVADVMDEIYAQFKPNDGKTMMDRIQRIDRNVQVNARNIEVVYGVIMKGHEFDPSDAPLLEPLSYEP